MAELPIQDEGAALSAPRLQNSLIARASGDEVDRLLDGRDLLGFLVGNLDAEFLFESHHELDGVERVGAEVIDDLGVTPNADELKRLFDFLEFRTLAGRLDEALSAMGAAVDLGPVDERAEIERRLHHLRVAAENLRAAGMPDQAERLMQQADVVVYDRLVSEPVLDMVRRDAELIYAGKQRDQHTLTQESINQLLVRLAKEGKRVLRENAVRLYGLGQVHLAS